MRIVCRLAAASVLLLLSLVACEAANKLEGKEAIESGAPGGNILLVLIDDLGVDKIRSYEEHPKSPPTPTIDSLAERGLLFRNAHAYAVCSPARAALMTGRYGRRNGIGMLTKGSDHLPTQEIGIAKVLDYSTAHQYSTSVVGKWHLAGPATHDWLKHPAALGFDWFAVAMMNLSHSRRVDQDFGYSLWWKNTNGQEETVTDYPTTDQVDDAIARIKAMPQPWFLYLSFSAPHLPAHTPPHQLHSYRKTGGSKRVQYNAAVESIDTELGRLLKSIDPKVLADTTIIVMGDNGTPDYAIEPPFNESESKGGLQDGGTRVPLIISGPLIGQAGSQSAALVHIVDIFPTIAEIAGADIEKLFGSKENPGSLANWPIDGDSLIPFLSDPDSPGREFIYTERFNPNGVGVTRKRDFRSIRNAKWRYIRDIEGLEELYDLAANAPNAGPNLLAQPLSAEATRARKRLSLELDRFISELGE
jgi:arylsulfatase A-like enzyme